MPIERFYNGQKIVTIGVYDAVYLTGHPRTLQNGTVYVHVLVAESKLKRYLKPEEVVHHIDENKQNNDENNIMIFASRKDHTRYHMAMRYDCVFNLIKTNGVYKCEINKRATTAKRNNGIVKQCVKCGKELPSLKSTFCYECFRVDQSKNVPSKEILEKLISNYSFEEIGRQYNVSGKAVKKWCDKYLLKKKTFYDIPPREQIIEIFNKTNTKKETAEKLNIPINVLLNWENKLNITVLPSGRVKCVELNQVFQNKKEAAKILFPQLNPHSCTNSISRACKQNSTYKDYHWKLLPQEAY